MSGNDVAKNTLYLTAASVGQKVLSFAYFLLVARVMRPEATGAYFLTLSLITVALTVSDFGTNNVVIRDLAKKPDDVALVRRALGVKAITVVAGMLFAVAAAKALGYDPAVVRLTALATLVLLLDTFSQFFYGVLRGLHKLGYESIGLMGGMATTLVVGVTALHLYGDLVTLVFALVCGSAFNLAFSAYNASKHMGRGILMPAWDLAGARRLVLDASPFLLAGVFVKAYGNIDVQFLNHYLGEAAVGIYAIAYKYTYAFQFLPLAFVAALYPGMSAKVGKDPEGLHRLFDRAVWYMLLIGTPLAFGLWAVASRLVTLVGADYAAAAPVLSVLCFALIPSFLDFPLGSLINASGRQAMKTVMFGITMLVNGLLNFLLIPAYGMIGAAAASIVSLCCLVAMGLWFVPTLIPSFRLSHFAGSALRFGASGAVMAVAARFVADLAGQGTVSLVLATAAGAISYPAMLLATKAVTRADVGEAMRLLRRKEAYVPSAAIDD